MVRCCIFDLDGVIVDTAKYHFIAWKKIANELNINFTENDNERLKGVSRMASLDILLSLGDRNFSDEEKFELAEKKNSIYVDYIKKISPHEILPGVKDFLRYLKKNDIQIALGSASKNAITILHQLNIEDMFDAIADGNNVKKAKPDPEVFLKAAELTKKSPAECIVFEDAQAGIEAAHKGGFKCIGIGNKNILKEADYVVRNFKNQNEIISQMEKMIN